MESLYITRSNMRRIGCIFCAFCILLSLTVYFVLRSHDRGIMQELERRLDELENAEYAVSIPVHTPLYYVGFYEGEAAVFSAADDRVIRLLGVRAETLPQSDRSLLEGRIAVYTDADLCAIIADYTG